MPRLSDERRKQLQEQQKRQYDFWAKIDAKYGRKEKGHAECRLCGDMVTARQPEDVFEVIKVHEQSHPEYLEWIALGKQFSFGDLPELAHDHHCIFVRCACQCGCTTSFCVADIPAGEQQEPMLCSSCMLYLGRGHDEHELRLR